MPESFLGAASEMTDLSRPRSPTGPQGTPTSANTPLSPSDSGAKRSSVQASRDSSPLSSSKRTSSFSDSRQKTGLSALRGPQEKAREDVVAPPLGASAHLMRNAHPSSAKGVAEIQKQEDEKFAMQAKIDVASTLNAFTELYVQVNEMHPDQQAEAAMALGERFAEEVSEMNVSDAMVTLDLMNQVVANLAVCKGSAQTVARLGESVLAASARIAYQAGLEQRDGGQTKLREQVMAHTTSSLTKLAVTLRAHGAFRDPTLVTALIQKILGLPKLSDHYTLNTLHNDMQWVVDATKAARGTPDQVANKMRAFAEADVADVFQRVFYRNLEHIHDFVPTPGSELARGQIEKQTRKRMEKLEAEVRAVNPAALPEAIRAMTWGYQRASNHPATLYNADGEVIQTGPPDLHSTQKSEEMSIGASVQPTSNLKMELVSSRTDSHFRDHERVADRVLLEQINATDTLDKYKKLREQVEVLPDDQRDWAAMALGEHFAMHVAEMEFRHGTKTLDEMNKLAANLPVCDGSAQTVARLGGSVLAASARIAHQAREQQGGKKADKLRQQMFAHTTASMTVLAGTLRTHRAFCDPTLVKGLIEGFVGRADQADSDANRLLLKREGRRGSHASVMVALKELPQHALDLPATREGDKQAVEMLTLLAKHTIQPLGLTALRVAPGDDNTGPLDGIRLVMARRGLKLSDHSELNDLLDDQQELVDVTKAARGTPDQVARKMALFAEADAARIKESVGEGQLEDMQDRRTLDEAKQDKIEEKTLQRFRGLAAEVRAVNPTALPEAVRAMTSEYESNFTDKKTLNKVAEELIQAAEKLISGAI
jgi:hypothetical protein